VLTDKGAGDLAALRDDLKTDIERVRSQEAQLRDRLSVEWQKSVTDIDSEQRRIRDGSATRVEMAAMEGRINGSIGKLEARIDRIDTKLESLPAMHAIMTTLVASVDRLSVAAGVRKPAP
jgi:RecB family exonuclease